MSHPAAANGTSSASRGPLLVLTEVLNRTGNGHFSVLSPEAVSLLDPGSAAEPGRTPRDGGRVAEVLTLHHGVIIWRHAPGEAGPPGSGACRARTGLESPPPGVVVRFATASGFGCGITAGVDLP